MQAEIIATPVDTSRVTVYRVVDSTELAYLLAKGNYGSSPSRSGKYFALTLTGALVFASHSMNAGSTVTSTTFPHSVMDLGLKFIDPGQHGAGLSIFFGEAQLPMVYNKMSPPVILSPAG